MRQSLICGVSSRTFDLIIIVVQSSDMSASEFHNLPSWSANTTTDIENLHSLLDADLICEIMFMSGNGLLKWFTVCKPAEMERLAPAILIQVCYEIVVTGNICQ